MKIFFFDTICDWFISFKYEDKDGTFHTRTGDFKVTYTVKDLNIEKVELKDKKGVLEAVAIYRDYHDNSSKKIEKRYINGVCTQVNRSETTMLPA